MTRTGYFATMELQGNVVVDDMPKFDLEPYMQNYKGPIKFERLLLIGRCSVPLHLDALKAAIAEAKAGKDVSKYREAWAYLRLAAPDDADAVLDQAWVDNTTVSNAATAKRLMAEMKVYKNNLVKDSIRMGQEEMGRHLEETGDLASGADAFGMMRPDVSSAKQLVQLGKHLTRVGIQRREWASVLAQLSKITGVQDKDDEQLNLPYIRALSGLAYLGQEKLEMAAKSFLGVGSGVLAAARTGTGTGTGSSSSSSSSSSSVESLSTLTEGMMAANDVAVYGGLLALATMNRAELQTKVLDNSSFRAFLELEPHVRRAISQFVNGRYKACLATLAAYRADWKLDLFLQKHTDTVLAQIRSKCITSYLAPFSVALFAKMEEAFCEPGQSIEAELTAMIKSGVLKAHVDVINKLVRMKQDGGRAKMQADAIAAMAKFEADSIDRLRRTNIIVAGVETRAPAEAPAELSNTVMA